MPISRAQWVEPQTGDRRVASLRLTAGGVTVLLQVYAHKISSSGSMFMYASSEGCGNNRNPISTKISCAGHKASLEKNVIV